MAAFERKTKLQIGSPIFQLLALGLILSLLPQPGTVQAQPTGPIQTIDLDLSTRDVARVEFGYHRSSFESQHIEYKLDVEAGILTDGNIKAPLSSLVPLLSGLKGMYPGTRPLYWASWSDDYPHAWIRLFLQDGRMVAISSDSQFDKMFPWNVVVWHSEKASQPQGSYIQLNAAFFDAIDLLWQGVGEEKFPRKGYEASFWKDMFENSASETVEFYHEDAAEDARVWGDSPASLSLFLPLLNRNPEIKSLLDAGYRLYDASFELEVQLESLEPIQYSGALALADPDGRDVVIGLVTLPLAEGQSVTTTLKAAESLRLVEQRRARPFLNEAEQILKPLTFLLDTRENNLIHMLPGLDCPENPDISSEGQFVQAIWDPVERMQVLFYPITDERWSVNLALQRGEANWNDATVRAILNAWFPEPIAALPVENLQAFDSHWKIAFQPDVTLRDPELLDRLAAALPEQTVIHKQNPEKPGDYGYLSLEGRVILSETGSAPVVTYCGRTLPDWYRPPYPIAEVVPPNDQVPRQDITTSRNGEWLSLLGELPHEQFRTHWTDVAFTQPGFLHVLWTDENRGVYYADGWIDGTGWTQPQRLGPDVYWVDIQSSPDGEIHLFWDTNAGGAIHVWRPAGGAWQKAEHWPAAFGEVLWDAEGSLHLGTFESDGLDGEFMYRTWSLGQGLSAPENISRQLGSTGSAGGILRFDSQGQLHAAWSHLLEEKAVPDPVTGETSDISGVYYARRLPDGRWSQPELVGTLTAYARALGMELDSEDHPLIVWQADNGLVSRVRKNEVWEEAIELAEVLPPETPAEFGPDRWVRPTAKLQTGVNSQGQILVAWLIPHAGLRLSAWSAAQWSRAIDIVPAQDIETLESEPLTLQMVVDDFDQVHFVFFKNDRLYYALYDNIEVKIEPLFSFYDGYGLPEATLLVDPAGSVAVLGLPRSPGFDVKIGPRGIPPTPTPIPLPTMTPHPTATPLAALNNGDVFSPFTIGLGITAALLVAGIGLMTLKRRKP